MVVTAWYNSEVPELIERCIASARRVFGEVRVLTDRPFPSTRLSLPVQSDIARLRWCSTHPHDIWVDADIEWFCAFEPNAPGVWTGSVTTAVADHDILCANGDTATVKEALERAEGMLWAVMDGRYGNFAKRVWAGVKTNRVPREYYKHYRYHRRKQDG